ncbi:MAG: hypothetical protein LUI08_01925 [Prevotella sp.]|nr:hypothetical protein [Prevotella sp.]MCD8305815.1 hypothetical protein [Prevotella sp.]
MTIRRTSIKTLTKKTVWDIQENDVFRLWREAEKDADLKDNKRHYLDIILSAFELTELPSTRADAVRKFERQGYKVGFMKGLGNDEAKWGVRKRKITRVGELTYDNIHHITAAELLQIIDRNFGGGWDSLTERTQDIIRSYFDISSTTLPKNRLRNKGGIYEKRTAEKYEVLEIPKGTWVEVIFAKEKQTIYVDDDDTPGDDEPDNVNGTIEDNDNYEEEFGEEGELADDDNFDDEEAYDEEAYDENDYADAGELTLDDVVAAEDEG